MPPLHGRSILLLEDVPVGLRVPARVAFTLAITAAMLGAVELLEPWFGRPYYFPGFAAVALAAVAAGTRYGLLATACFGLGQAFFFLEPRGELAMRSSTEVAGLAGYTAVAAFVSWVGGSLRHAFARLREQTRDLERIQAQREDLVRSLTHDIRSPLSAIALNAGLIRKAEPGAELVRRAATIEASVASAAAMLEDLVEVARLESGNVALERRPVAVDALVSEVRERLPTLAAHERVRVEVPRGLPPVNVDAPRFERVLVNLVVNALKYSPEGSPVLVAASPREGGVELTVRDEGPGLAPEELSRVFEKYYRAHASREKDGLGLGLYISRLLVEAHGGRIWATSAGKGTTFHVSLPGGAAHLP